MGIFNSKVSPVITEKQGDSYDNIKSLIRPLDLILFRGDDFVSKTIQYLSSRQLGPEAAQYSHCGLIVTKDVLNIPELEAGKLYIFESTMSGNLTDGVKNIHGHSFLGCQIRPFDEVIVGYNTSEHTQINWCKLKNNPIDHGYVVEIQNIMLDCYNSYNGIRYEYNIFNICAALFPILRFCRPTVFENKFMFCSELVATIYKRFGIFNGRPANVVPADFMIPDADNELDSNLFECVLIVGSQASKNPCVLTIS
jgi:hypothetical protein